MSLVLLFVSDASVVFSFSFLDFSGVKFVVDFCVFALGVLDSAISRSTSLRYLNLWCDGEYVSSYGVLMGIWVLR